MHSPYSGYIDAQCYSVVALNTSGQKGDHEKGSCRFVDGPISIPDSCFVRVFSAVHFRLEPFDLTTVWRRTETGSGVLPTAYQFEEQEALQV